MTELLCSAKGCRKSALFALRWNNPKIHDPQRRKTWLACADHLGSLSAFLEARGFLRSVDELPEPGGPPQEHELPEPGGPPPAHSGDVPRDGADRVDS